MVPTPWSEKWRGKTWAFLVFLVILVLHCVAIVLFTSGFLLTRTELSHYSHCSDVSESPCFTPPSTKEQHASEDLHNFSNIIAGPGCWTKPAVNRLVVIVLDALRFDFVAPSTFFAEKKPWMDKLQVLHELASQQGSSARIFKAVADPPTTSLQRLKGLTTGGLPTFIDVGNSFGAPAIVEDNLIYQLAQSGKRVMMMGDDTWLQLFPHHFNKSYPFPSFNVKDLDTVDNGCIDHLFPSLYEEDWDVLIAHFLGVDHAGHIFGVDSPPMIEKLEQYNDILEKVVKVLESLSGPGGLHENTLLLVMGDHGQTLNGDHGGGSPEEVETSIFAMSLKKPLPSVPLEFDDSSCRLDLDGRKVCVSYIEQLDFAVTVSALLGIPFPYGSIGRVNPSLYALVAGTWNLDSYNVGSCQGQSKLEKWMHNYANVLCINSWQVKKYIDVYSASSVIGFSKEDLLHVEQTYSQAVENWSKDSVRSENGSCGKSLTTLKRQIDSYSKFLASVAELARTKWTEFNLEMMGIGLGIMLTSIFIHFFAIKRLDKQCGIYFPSIGDSGTSFKLIFACIVVMIRACSFLSNSYILEEGKVVSFLLASTGMLYLRYSIMINTMFMEAVSFVLLISTLRFAIELGLSKQGVDSVFMKLYPSWMLGIDKDSHLWIYVADIMPMLALILLAYMLYKIIIRSSCKGSLKYIIGGTILSYMLIVVHWASESNLPSIPIVLKDIRGNYIPRIIYAIGFAQLLALALIRFFNKKNTLDWEGIIAIEIVAMLCAWSSTVIILSGKQGPFVALAVVLGGWCIMRLNNVEVNDKNRNKGILNFYSSPVTQWSLLATCLFFCSGHWCAFDGLRYAAAFIGFDEFSLIRQAVLLTIDTFGFSHIIPIFGLPLLIVRQYPFIQAKQRKQLFYMQLSQVYLLYGLIMAITTTFTILCVTIQRRHLMVWGLFAPKFVFDVVGLILTDVLICFASLFYFG